ncbi:hypothetical protein GOBAR_DD08411 [Gossypium barbadense]|nr:hypothetical protein GOBAR_DD08411 [Gossypium barbadense]
MGVFAKEAEVSTPLSPTKAFKAFAVDLDTLMPKKISYETKFVAAADGGTSIKVTTTFYTIGDIQISPDLMLQVKEASEKRALVLKAIENYVLANPDF